MIWELPLGVRKRFEQGCKRGGKKNSEDGAKRVINIGALNEEELLGMIKGYVNVMIDFANKTRNAHKELKDTLTNTGMVLNQYLKIKSSTHKDKETKNTSTQTKEIPIDNIQPEGSHRKKVKTTEVSTDTPCWWPTLLEREPGPATNQLQTQQPQQNKEEHGDGGEFTVVKRKKDSEETEKSFSLSRKFRDGCGQRESRL